MRAFIYILFALILSAASCEKNFPDDGVMTNSKSAELLKKVPENIVIEGKSLELSAELWRDFMPGFSDSERSLRAAVSISVVGDSELPTGLTFEKLAVSHGDSLWVESIDNSERSNDTRLQANTKGGPEWAPKSMVDVIVQLTHKEKIYKLRKNAVEIRATY